MVSQDAQITEVITRGVEAVYPSAQALEKRLREKKKMRIYMGIDPTGPLHIGHGVVLLKMRQLQALGHEIIILIGDFTAQIGDPTDKKATRQALSEAQVRQNAKDYQRQVKKILNAGRVKFVQNKQWTNKLKPVDLLQLASHFTVARLLERDMFQERIKAGKDIHVHEFLYPVFQAYDAVALDVDMQVGGNDQTFNMLAGRTLLKKLKDKEKFVIATKLLTDPSGKKMGKTEGNMINLHDAPEDMYGKVMSWPDELIEIGFEVATQAPLSKIGEIKKSLKKGDNPKVAKMLLAYTIVEQYHSTNAAIAAEEAFKQVFEKGLNPDDITEFAVPERNIVDVLVATKLADSKSEARRFIEQGGVKVADQVVKDVEYTIDTVPVNGLVIQRGKRHFAKLIK